MHGAREHAVDREQARTLIKLVLDLRALRDLDDDAEVPVDPVAKIDVVPRVHRLTLCVTRMQPRTFMGHDVVPAVTFGRTTSPPEQSGKRCRRPDENITKLDVIRRPPVSRGH
jgi:hypothetical protein